MTISQTALDVRARARQGLVGQPAASGHLLALLTLLNSDPQAAQVSTVTISGTTGSAKTITINGIDVTGTGLSTTAIATSLAEAVEAEPGVRGQVTATANASDVILTGLTPGLAFTVEEDDAEVSVALTSAAASAAAIPFGRLVLDDGAEADAGPTRLGKLAQSSAFSAQTGTITVTFAAGEVYAVSIVDMATGAILATVSEPADTDSDTTAANLRASLNAALPANTVDATVATNVITLTAEVAGFEFEASGGATGAGVLAFADTNGPSLATSLARAASGISMHSIMDEAATVGALEGEYPANHGFRALSAGPIWVDRPGAVSKGDPVFVELASGDDAGKFYTSGGATRVRLGSLSWERDGRTAADGLAVLRVDLA